MLKGTHGDFRLSAQTASLLVCLRISAPLSSSLHVRSTPPKCLAHPPV